MACVDGAVCGQCLEAGRPNLLGRCAVVLFIERGWQKFKQRIRLRDIVNRSALRIVRATISLPTLKIKGE